jgi:hypothetical protein
MEALDPLDEIELHEGLRDVAIERRDEHESPGRALIPRKHGCNPPVSYYPVILKLLEGFSQ